MKEPSWFSGKFRTPPPNHRTVEVRSDLCRSSCLILLMTQGHLEPPTCSWPRPDILLMSPRMETPQPVWATCASAWSPSQRKKHFLKFRGNLLFQSVPVASCPVTALQKKPGSDLFSLFFQILVYIGKQSLSLLFSRLTSSSSLSLPSYEWCSRPFIIFMDLCWTLSSMSPK